MKFNLLVLALLGHIDAETLKSKQTDSVGLTSNGTNNASALTNATALAAVNATSNATGKAKDTTWTSSSSSSSTTTSWTSSSSSSWSSSSSSSSGGEWGGWSMSAPMVETETNVE